MITIDLADYGEYDGLNMYFRNKDFKKIHESEDNIVKLIHENKSCIIRYMGSSSDSCNKCCFMNASRCKSLIGVSDCSSLPIVCGPGYFKTIDDIMEDL